MNYLIISRLYFPHGILISIIDYSPTGGTSLTVYFKKIKLNFSEFIPMPKLRKNHFKTFLRVKHEIFYVFEVNFIKLPTSTISMASIRAL